MVCEAKNLNLEDDKIKRRMKTMYALESYCFQMKNTLNDKKLANFFNAKDKKLIQELSTQGL